MNSFIISEDGKVSHVVVFDKPHFANEDKLFGLLREHFQKRISYDTDKIESLVGHELGHALHNSLALKRIGYVKGWNLTPLQANLFAAERNRISQEVYLAAFGNEDYDYETIISMCKRDLGSMAEDANELIAQSFGNYYFGKTKSDIAKRIVQWFMEEMN